MVLLFCTAKYEDYRHHQYYYYYDHLYYDDSCCENYSSYDDFGSHVYQDKHYDNQMHSSAESRANKPKLMNIQ